MSLIRASTQILDDESVFLTDEQKLILERAIQSIPNPGEQTVVRIKREVGGNLVFEYEEDPV